MERTSPRLARRSDLDSNSQVAAWLIRYFGLFQAIHVLVNLRALARFKREQDTFPTNPPTDGWDEGTQATMEGMAYVDTVAGILTLAFVLDYERDGNHWPLLGAVALTIANYSAILFAFPTRRVGAWDEHPLEYWGLYLAYLPIVALTVLYMRWNLRGEL